METSTKKTILAGATALLLIGLATWAADFRIPLDGDEKTSVALLADDWAIYATLIWSDVRPAKIQVREIFLESWEGRPLRALEYSLLWISYSLWGLSGGFWLQLLIICLSGWLFALLLKRQFSAPLALLGGLLVVLHPADTTHVWLATMMAKLGILHSLVAIKFFVHGRHVAAGLFLATAFLSYELSPFVFALAPFFADGGSRQSAKRAATVFGWVLVSYVAWRLFVLAEAAPDVRRLLEEDIRFDLRSYLTTPFRSIKDLLWDTTFASPLSPSRLIVASILGAATIFSLLASTRMRSTPSQNARPGRAVAWGLLGIVAGAALSFVATPNAAQGIASRHNIVGIFGATLIFVALVSYGSKASSRKWVRVLTMTMALSIPMIFLIQRSTIQQSYVEASEYQRRILAESLTAIGPVPPHTLIVLGKPLCRWHKRNDVVAPFITGHAYEIEAICELVFDKSVVGFCWQESGDHLRGQTSTAAAILNGKNNNFHSIVQYDCKAKKVTWVRKISSGKVGKSIKPNGAPWRYILGT